MLDVELLQKPSSSAHFQYLLFFGGEKEGTIVKILSTHRKNWDLLAEDKN